MTELFVRYGMAGNEMDLNISGNINLTVYLSTPSTPDPPGGPPGNTSHEFHGVPNYIPPCVSYIGTITGTIVSITGIFGNLLLIIAILTIPKMKKASNIFVASLAFCDLLQALGVQPLYIYTYVHGAWTFSTSVCIYVMYLSNLSILLSILHIAVIAFYRYLIVVHRRTSRKMHKKLAIFIILGILYLLPLVIIVAPTLPKLVGYAAAHPEGSPLVYFNTKIMFCVYKRHSSSNIGGFIKKVLFLGGAGLFLIFCYVKIYASVKESGKLVAKSGSHETYTMHRMKREYKLLKTMVVIFVTFVLCYTPLSILNGVDRKNAESHEAYLATVQLLWLSSSINWVIYGVMNHQYCAAYRYIVCRVCCGRNISDPRAESLLSMNGHGSTFRRNMTPRCSTGAGLRNAGDSNNEPSMSAGTYSLTGHRAGRLSVTVSG